jgi:hypothetical protein
MDEKLYFNESHESHESHEAVAEAAESHSFEHKFELSEYLRAKEAEITSAPVIPVHSSPVMTIHDDEIPSAQPAEDVSPPAQEKAEKAKLSSAKRGSLAEESDETLLKRHHMQALRQASIQFWAGLASAAIGFVFIIYMISSLQAAVNVQWYEYVSGSLPGTVIAVVSGLFFKQAQATRDRGTEFFEKLNYQKQVFNSVAIAESIIGDDLQAQVKAQIALRIIGIEPLQKLEGKPSDKPSEKPSEEEI